MAIVFSREKFLRKPTSLLFFYETTIIRGLTRNPLPNSFGLVFYMWMPDQVRHDIMDIMKQLTITTYSAKETQKVARLFAQELVKSGINRKTATVLALNGNLGGGKTTFTQGFARGLGIRDKITSPTFVILKSFKFQASSFRKFIHMDAYRLKSARELHPLGWRDILKDKDAIVLVEWADRIQKALPKKYIHIRFEFVDEKTRVICVMPF